MLATAIYYVIEYAGLMQKVSKAKRIVVQSILLFIVLFLLNLVWPYGSGLFL